MTDHGQAQRLTSVGQSRIRHDDVGDLQAHANSEPRSPISHNTLITQNLIYLAKIRNESLKHHTSRQQCLEDHRQITVTSITTNITHTAPSNSHPRCDSRSHRKGHDARNTQRLQAARLPKPPHDPNRFCKSNNTPTNNLLLLSAALKTHPDRVPADSPERDARTRKFQLVNDAYYTLSDAARRRDYDAQRRLFAPSAPGADPFEEADEAGAANNAERERTRTEDAQFSDVFEEMMREEGMAEDGSNAPTSKFWSLVGGLSGGALGFIIANFPGMLAGAVAGNRLGAVRDAKGKSVYEVYSVSLPLTAFQGLLGR